MSSEDQRHSKHPYAIVRAPHGHKRKATENRAFDSRLIPWPLQGKNAISGEAHDVDAVRKRHVIAQYPF